MLDLSAKNIRLNSSAVDKQQAIRLIAADLEQNGFVAEGYAEGMLAREEQTSTFLGNGIAIPHGTLDTRHLVQQTGVQIYQFPQGIVWGEGNVANVVIGIAAKSDEHLTLLRQLTSVLSDEDAATKLAQTQSLDEFVQIIRGQKSLPLISPELISLNIETSSLLTLAAFNATQLQEKGYVNQQFVRDAIAAPQLYLGENLYFTDAPFGVLQNGLSIARNTEGKTLITAAALDHHLQPILARLFEQPFNHHLSTADSTQIMALFSASDKTQENSTACQQVIGTFSVRNEHGLHARPTAVLVQTLKPFEAKVTVENLDRQSTAVNAKSTMRVVSLGATKNHRLRFVAEGDDALQAIEALAKAFVDGLGEAVSNEAPAVPDSIETVGVQAVEKSQNSAPLANELEATFVIHNEHGLHARPSAVLVNEVKKYNADIKVQNVDRDSPFVSAKSLMKIVSLGVTKGQRLRFTATGEEAQQALAGIEAAINAGLGE